MTLAILQSSIREKGFIIVEIQPFLFPIILSWNLFLHNPDDNFVTHLETFSEESLSCFRETILSRLFTGIIASDSIATAWECGDADATAWPTS